MFELSFLLLILIRLWGGRWARGLRRSAGATKSATFRSCWRFLAPRSAVFKAGGPTDDDDADDDDVLLIADAYKGLLAVARPHGRAPSLSRLGAATYLNDVVAAPCAEINPWTRFQCEGIQFRR